MNNNTADNNEKLALAAPGCLGTCWYGKYHYIEPWVGCEHDCTYCYAKIRTPVLAALKTANTDFVHPAVLEDTEDMLNHLHSIANSGVINIAKLSRYTDIFTPKFVRNGLTYEVLKILAESKVNRIIITTKGVPDEKSFSMIEKNRNKFSYNTVAKPATDFSLEGSAVASLSARLNAAARINKAGVLTTIHMDPLIPGMEDSENLLQDHFQQLKKLELNRVMFSYLLLNPAMIDSIRKNHGINTADAILAYYENLPRKVLPKDEETIYISCQPALKQESIRRISHLLSTMGFEYVLCSLKSGRQALIDDNKLCNLCDGGFYA